MNGVISIALTALLGGIQLLAIFLLADLRDRVRRLEDFFMTARERV